MSKMNKSEFIDAIAKLTGASKAQVNNYLCAEQQVITKELKKNGSIQVTGWGSWSVAKRSARTGRNPATGKSIKIPAAKTPKFKAGALLKKAVQ